MSLLFTNTQAAPVPMQHVQSGGHISFTGKPHSGEGVFEIIQRLGRSLAALPDAAPIFRAQPRCLL
jgi:hypothetical protein